MTRLALNCLFIMIATRMIHHSSESLMPIRSMISHLTHNVVLMKHNNCRKSLKQVTMMSTLYKTNEWRHTTDNYHRNHDNCTSIASRVLQSATGQES